MSATTPVPAVQRHHRHAGARNDMMHPRNPYKDKPPDFAVLAAKYPEFRAHCFCANGQPVTDDVDHLRKNKVRLRFRDPEAVRVLTWACLLDDFNLDVELPPDSLVPRIPLRINYILWLQDLVHLNDLNAPVTGIDIGTGASCVYPLLGARLCDWYFIGSESNERSIAVAQRNVTNNGLDHRIVILSVGDEASLITVVERFPERSFTFCMCNPPFFEAAECDRFEDATATNGGLNADGNSSGGGKEVDDRMINRLIKHDCDGQKRDKTANNWKCKTARSRSVKRAPPHSATIAKRGELCYEGGEVAFVSKIIDDSVYLKSAVKIYSSMLGKRSSLGPLKQRLMNVPGVKFAETAFYQGKTIRWALAWTFVPQICLGESAKEAKVLKIYEVALPESWKSAANPKARIGAVDKRLQIFKDLMTSLSITYCEQDVASSKRFVCEAVENTWSNQRRKRRAMQRADCDQPNKCARVDIIGGVGRDCAVAVRCPATSRDVEVSARLGTGDGTDSYTDDGNFCAVVVEDSSCGDRLIGCNNNSNNNNNDDNDDNNSLLLGQRSVAVQTYLPVERNERLQTCTNTSRTVLVRFNAVVAPYGRNVIQFKWVGGRNKDALNQIVQYCRNVLNA